MIWRYERAIWRTEWSDRQPYFSQLGIMRIDQSYLHPNQQSPRYLTPLVPLILKVMGVFDRYFPLSFEQGEKPVQLPPGINTNRETTFRILHDHDILMHLWSRFPPTISYSAQTKTEFTFSYRDPDHRIQTVTGTWTSTDYGVSVLKERPSGKKFPDTLESGQDNKQSRKWEWRPVYNPFRALFLGRNSNGLGWSSIVLVISTFWYLWSYYDNFLSFWTTTPTTSISERMFQLADNVRENLSVGKSGEDRCFYMLILWVSTGFIAVR